MAAQSAPRAYALYTPNGKEVKYKKMIRELRSADVILFGEYHNNPISHWLQREVAGELGDFDLGLEMFETDEQAALNAFLAKEIDLEELDKRIEGTWNNFKTDYLPLVSFAGDAGAGVFATNVPRTYARAVAKNGFAALNSLPDAELALIAPAPPPYDPELPSYKAMLAMMPDGHAGENFPKAQAIKDATMAHFILQNLREGRPMLHLNGSYHSDDHEGIFWYLNAYAPDKKVVTITTVEQENVDELADENASKADYILVVPERMTKTF